MEKKKPLLSFTTTVGRIILLGLIILFLVNIVRSIYKNHNIKKQISQLEDEISTLKNERLNLENRILYYNTDTFKELEARKHLNYKKKDEKVVSLISKEDTLSQEINKIKHNTETNQLNRDNSIPNWQKWMKYIFG